MKFFTIILALAGVTVLASPASQREANTLCGSCDFGGVGQDLRTNSPNCTPLHKFGGSSTGTCVNLHCRICMFFKDNDCKNMDLSWAGAGSPYFSAAKFNSYSCVGLNYLAAHKKARTIEGRYTCGSSFYGETRDQA